MGLLKGRGAWLEFIGCVMVVLEAVILPIDKAALRLVPRVFYTLTKHNLPNRCPELKHYLIIKDIWLLSGCCFFSPR